MTGIFLHIGIFVPSVHVSHDIFEYLFMSVHWRFITVSHVSLKDYIMNKRDIVVNNKPITDE